MTASAQDAIQTAPEPNLRITAVGGFLGYLDGLTKDQTTRGGLLGVQDWLSGRVSSPNGAPAFVRGRDLLLVTGNNVPLETGGNGRSTAPAWSALSALQADAVALSIDDFLRSLRRTGGAPDFLRDLHSAEMPPLVASNAIVRARKKNMNRIVAEGLGLEISSDESVGWLTKIRVSGGTCTGLVASIADTTEPTSPLPTVGCDPADADHFTITLKPSLRPGRSYNLTLTVPGRQPALFTFTTHRPLLALAGGAGVPASIAGLPVRLATRRFDGSTNTYVIIVGMVDPGTKARLGAERWKWTRAQAECGGDECAIDFLPPAEALTALAGLSGQAPSDGRNLFVLMSGLSDADTLALVTAAVASAKISLPIVLLDPDSSILGRDIGHYSIVNANDSATTQIWARPTWIGTYADILTARVDWTNVAGRWLVANAAATTSAITGYPAIPSKGLGPVSYVAGNPSATPLGTFERYPVLSSTKVLGESIWRALAALALDVMRRSAHADLALIPKHMIDEDIVGWLSEESAKAPLDWTSRYVLAKAFYRLENIVAVDIEGAKLAGVLDGIVKAQATDDETVFVAGTGSENAVSQIDTKHLLVNGRAIVSDRFYKLAIPESIAEAQQLTVAQRNALPSLLDALDARFRGLRRDRTIDAATVASQFNEAFTRRPQFYFNLNPATVSYFRLTPTNPAVLKVIPLAGADVKDERKWGLSGKVDLGWDFARWAVRGIGDLKFAKDTVIGATSTQTTFPDDEWTFGVRGDWKLDGGAWRLFGGRFKQSQLRDRQDKPVTPTRKAGDLFDPSTNSVVTGTISGETVTPVVKDPTNPDKPAYVFWRVGLDGTSHRFTSWLSAKDLAAAFDSGTVYNDRTGVVIDGTVDASIDQVYLLGLQDFLNGEFARVPEAFAVPRQLTFTHRRFDQRRLQFDGTAELKSPATWPRLIREAALTNTVRHRRYYPDEPQLPLTANSSLDLQTKLEWTTINRLKFGPYVNYYRVRIKPTADGKTPDHLSYTKIGIEVSVPIFAALFAPARVWQ